MYLSSIEIPWIPTEELWNELLGMYEHAKTLVLHNMLHTTLDAFTIRLARPRRMKTNKNVMAGIAEEYYDTLRVMESKYN